MSQMTVTQMSISETTDSPQHKLHWLAEQALSWSGLPVVTVRPTVFLEGFFLQLAAPGVRASDELALPMGGGKTSPISAVDVARAVAVILDDPAHFQAIHRCNVDVTHGLALLFGIGTKALVWGFLCQGIRQGRASFPPSVS